MSHFSQPCSSQYCYHCAPKHHNLRRWNSGYCGITINIQSEKKQKFPQELLPALPEEGKRGIQNLKMNYFFNIAKEGWTSLG